MESLLTTISHRPYVFTFLIAYIILARRIWSAPRIILWLLSGYAIAWMSELSSIHNGFPYGEYHYIYDNLKGELLVAGVPFFDSLSYTFLIFAGFTTAEYILSKPESGSRFTVHGSRFTVHGSRFTVHDLRLTVLGAFLTMMLDVIVDPIATMGDKWFLGKIHFYAHPGFYFGVPLSNFAGWFLVSFTVIAFNTLIWAACPFFNGSRFTVHGSRKGLFYPLFYFSIALFNIAVTFRVGEWRLGLASGIIFLLLLASLLWTSHRHPANQQSIKIH